MTTPTVIVLADLSGTAFGGTPTWTDITQYVTTIGGGQPISITVGRSDEMSTVAPSQCSFTLVNDDGRFTPGRSASPYYPNVLPGVRVNVSAVVGGTTYYRFDGYVDSWEQGWEGGSDAAVVQVTATDILARFGTGNPLRAIYAEEALIDAPLALWPLTEDGLSTSAGNVSTSQQTSLVATGGSDPSSGDATFANGIGLPSDGLSCLTLNTSLTSASADDLKGYYLTGPPVPALGNTFSIEAWIRLDPNLSAAMSRHTLGPTAIPVPVACIYDSNGNVLAGIAVWYTGGTVRAANFTSSNWPGFSVSYGTGPYINLNDGKLHHVVFVANGATGHLYVDGNNDSPSVAFNAVSDGGRLMVGGPPPGSGFYGQAPLFRGSIQYLAVYPTALDPVRVFEHYGAANTTGERTDIHMARLVDYRPNLGRTLDPGSGHVGTHDTTGVTLQQALLDTAAAEGGFLWVDGVGEVRMKARTVQYNPSTALTLDASLDQVTADLRFHIDTQQLTNDVTVTRPSGATQRVLDATSQATYGIRASSETLIVDSDQDALNGAGWLLACNKDAQTRSPNLTVDLLSEPSLSVTQAVLAIEPWSKIAVNHLPTAAPSTSAQVWVQGWTEQLGVDTWQIQFNTTPLAPQVFRIDASSTGFNHLDAGLVIPW